MSTDQTNTKIVEAVSTCYFKYASERLKGISIYQVNSDKFSDRKGKFIRRDNGTNLIQVGYRLYSDLKCRLYFFICLVLIFISACKPDSEGLPVFNIRLADSTTILNTNEIPEGKVIVMIHFDADCGECQQETDSLLQHMEALRDIQFYFVTVGSFSQVHIFKEYYHLDRYPNIIIGQDEKQSFPRHFKTMSTPLLAIYDRKKKLRGVFNGKPLFKDLVGKIIEAEQ